MPLRPRNIEGALWSLKTHNFNKKQTPLEEHESYNQTNIIKNPYIQTQTQSNSKIMLKKKNFIFILPQVCSKYLVLEG